MQGDNFGTETTKEDHELAYNFGYNVVVKQHRRLGKIPRSGFQDKGNKNKSTLTFNYL